MAISDRIMKLSKYMISLPKTKISVFLIIIFSFLTGSIADCIVPGIPLDGIVYSFISGGTTSFFLFGLTAIISGGIIHSSVNSLKKRHMKLKQAMFLSFISMFFVCVTYVLGSIISVIVKVNLYTNSILFGILIAFAIEALILWATSNIRYYQGVLIAAVQPLLILSMTVLVNYLQVATSNSVVLALYFKAIIGAILLAVAIYAFVSIIQSPIKNNLGVGGLELLSLFIAQITDGSNALESVFDDMGEEIDTTVGLISFKTEKGIKANYISPCVHPGPVGSIGGGNLPTVIANDLDDFAIVAHGAATHDFNPVAEKEVYNITRKIKEALPTLEYSSKASEFQRVQSDDAKIGIQFFDKGAVELVTFAPNPGDDIDYGVGLALMYKTKAITGIQDVVFVDCHNCLEGNWERLLPGHNRVLQLENAVDKIQNVEMYPIKMGYAYEPLDEIPIKDGIGESGVKIMLVEVNTQKMLYIVYDGNNMKQGFREELIKAINDKYPEIDMIETMTTDTHMVNTISGGGLTVGSRHSETIINKTLDIIPEALDDLEDVEVASATIRVNLKTLGPNHTTELVTTIASVVSVSKLLAPVIFIVAIILTIIWIF